MATKTVTLRRDPATGQFLPSKGSKTRSRGGSSAPAKRSNPGQKGLITRIKGRGIRTKPLIAGLVASVLGGFLLKLVPAKMRTSSWYARLQEVPYALGALGAGWYLRSDYLVSFGVGAAAGAVFNISLDKLREAFSGGGE